SLEPLRRYHVKGEALRARSRINSEIDTKRLASRELVAPGEQMRVVMVHANRRQVNAAAAPAQKKIAENNFGRRGAKSRHQRGLFRPLLEGEPVRIDINLG